MIGLLEDGVSSFRATVSGSLNLVNIGGFLLTMKTYFNLDVGRIIIVSTILQIKCATMLWWSAQLTREAVSQHEMAFRWCLTDFSPGTGWILSMLRDRNGLYSLRAIISTFFLDLGNKHRPPLAFRVSQKGLACRAAASANYLNCKVQMVVS